MREMLKLLNFSRRGIGKMVDRDYLKKKLRKRKGKCRKCGQCCLGCGHLDETGLCKRYVNRPFLCYKDFPLDRFDQKVWDVKNCGYSFD